MLNPLGRPYSLTDPLCWTHKSKPVAFKHVHAAANRCPCWWGKTVAKRPSNTGLTYVLMILVPSRYKIGRVLGRKHPHPPFQGLALHLRTQLKLTEPNAGAITPTT